MRDLTAECEARSSWKSAVVAVVISALALIGCLIVRQALEQLPTTTPDAESRRAAAEALWNDYPALPEPDTALFLREQAKSAYDTSLTGYIAGGASILTVLGAYQGRRRAFRSNRSWFSRSHQHHLLSELSLHPSPAEFFSPALALSPKSRFHNALAIAERFNKRTIQIAKKRRFDAVAWTIAQISPAILAGAVLTRLSISRMHSDAEGPYAA